MCFVTMISALPTRILLSVTAPLYSLDTTFPLRTFSLKLGLALLRFISLRLITMEETLAGNSPSYWQERSAPTSGTLKVAVNLSPVQFKSEKLLSAVVAALATSTLSANRLELEITESVLLQESEATLAVLHQLRALGVRISMDDFGTGYSSLAYLRKFPFDKIKIDRSFTREMANRSDSLAIVRAVIAMSASLGIATTAEGVETREQLEQLGMEGCTEAQGYFFNPPRPATEIKALLAECKRDLRATA